MPVDGWKWLRSLRAEIAGAAKCGGVRLRVVSCRFGKKLVAERQGMSVTLAMVWPSGELIYVRADDGAPTFGAYIAKAMWRSSFAGRFAS